MRGFCSEIGATPAATGGNTAGSGAEDSVIMFFNRSERPWTHSMGSDVQIPVRNHTGQKNRTIDPGHSSACCLYQSGPTRYVLRHQSAAIPTVETQRKPNRRIADKPDPERHRAVRGR